VKRSKIELRARTIPERRTRAAQKSFVPVSDMSSPRTFAEDEAGSWNLWVVDHELPAPPKNLEKGDSVPVARWAGPNFGAVLRVEWSWGHDDLDEDHLISVVQVMKRKSRGWEESPGDGGGGWFDPPLRRPAIGRHDVRVGGLHMSGGENWMCTALWGLVGSDVSTVDLIAEDRVISRAVDSAIGAVVVVFDSTVPAAIHLSSSDGALVKALSYNPETFSLE
jgi:hypothetical protein